MDIFVPSYYQPTSINVIYHQQLSINIDVDIQMAINDLDNKNSDVLKQSSVLFMKPIDININQLIMYNNYDGNASIHGTSITQKAGNLRRGKAENWQAFVLGQRRLSLQIIQNR
jgi:hypothetical protein